MSLPPGVSREHPLSRLTTIRVGGPADYFAEADSEQRLTELLAWADAEGHELGVVGSGSNLLVADQGFRGLVLKLSGALAAIERSGDRGVLAGVGRGCRRSRRERPTGDSPESSSASTSRGRSEVPCA